MWRAWRIQYGNDVSLSPVKRPRDCKMTCANCTHLCSPLGLGQSKTQRRRTQRHKCRTRQFQCSRYEHRKWLSDRRIMHDNSNMQTTRCLSERAGQRRHLDPNA